MKYLPIILVGLLISPSISFAAAFNNNLYYGSTGQDVSALQEFLTDQGVYSGPITGNFYSLTLAAVKRFQTANNIFPVSGYFGVLSRGVANTLLEPVAPIEETGTTTAPIVIPPTVIQAPPAPQVETPPIANPPSNPQPTFGSVAPACDTTPQITLTLSQDSINLKTNQDSYINVSSNVVDGCGKNYAYSVQGGSQTFKVGLTGTYTTAVSGGNIWQWEISHPDVAQGAPSTYPYPITVSTGYATSTAYVQVQ